MNIKWHALPFTHVEDNGGGCGREAQILEICVSSDGCICVSGICITCGAQFSSPEMPWATIMRSVSVKDYRSSLIEKPLDVLADMETQGRPC